MDYKIIIQYFVNYFVQYLIFNLMHIAVLGDMLMLKSTNIFSVKFFFLERLCGESVPNQSLLSSVPVRMLPLLGSEQLTGFWNRSLVWHRAKGGNLAQVDTFFSLCLRNELQDSDLFSFTPQ